MTVLPKDAVAELRRENARLQAELGAARDRQNASAEILAAIAGASGDAEQSLKQIAETTARLFGASSVTLNIARGDEWIRMIRVGASSKRVGSEVSATQLRIGGRNLPSSVFRENRQIHIPDLDNLDPAIADWPTLPIARAAGARAMAGTPLRREGKAIGALIAHRDRPVPFTDEELALLQSFADQAVIAIENARLFNETTQSLARQTATSDVLRVISRSPTDVQPVFDAIVLTAARLLRCDRAFIQRCDGAAFWTVASAGPDGPLPITQSSKAPIDPDANFPSRAIVAKKTLHLPDWSAIDLPEHERRIRELHGLNCALYMPLLREGECIGLLAITGKQAGMFGESEIALAESFRDQALIAIENTRLFNETQEALERQTATADILKVIASSPDDVQPVFDAIATSSKQLIGAFSATVFRFVDGIVNLAAYTPISPAADTVLKASFPRPAAGLPFFELAKGGKVVQEADSETNPDVAMRDIARARGFRSSLFSPLMKKETPIGLIVVTRKEIGTFSEHHVQLLQTFADQAVIAIENVRLFNETKEALERQTATAEILKVIASSPSDVQPVFEAIATSANRLIGGFSTAVLRFIDGMAHLTAFTPTAPDADDVLRSHFPRPVDGFEAAEMAQRGRPGTVTDTEEVADRRITEIGRARGFRSMLFVPLMNSGVPIGLISVTRVATGPFADHHVQLLQTFADQALIAIENVRLFNETKEALERQTATSDILKVIASSPSDVQPVFEAIAASSNRLIGGFSTAVLRFIGNELHLAAFTPTNATADEALKASFPRPLAEFPPFMLVRDGETVRIVDTEADDVPQLIREVARLRGYRSMLYTPLMSGGTPIGLISVTRAEPGTFADHHVQLVRTFADQAVIAIENVRLFDEVQAKTRDLTEALTYQTGSSNILNVIASSPTDVGPVLKAIVESACELCGAYDAMVRLKDGNNLRFSAHHGPISINHDSLPINRRSAVGLAVIEQKPVHVHDLLSSGGDAFPEAQERARSFGHRTVLTVPLLREGESIGAIILRRTEVNPFTDKQIMLLQTFADQAVIAIGNVRLFDEVQAKTRDLTEALTYQTGSSNILSVIASSPTDIKPVLKAIAESACQLCEAADALVALKDNDDLLLQAQHGSIPVAWERTPINRQWASGRAVVDREPVHVHDVLSAQGEMFPATREFARQSNVRTILSVPLLREGDSIGAIALRRTEVRPFTEKQIALLQTFADQAVIAIGNVRLFEEVQAKTRDLSESLQFQTASSEVLKVISRSPDALQPVLDVIVETSRELCSADASTIFLLRDRKFHVAAVSGSLPTHLEFLRANPAAIDQPGSILARVAREKRTLHYPNVADDPELNQGSTGRGGPRALLTVPLMRDDEVIGGITLRQSHLKPFTERQIEAIETFADQAVIAISNVGLFEQVQERTRELSKSLDELRTAQDRLVQTEKLASLGQLTAGIAHEIKNPLNFVNNFAALSAELTDELNQVLSAGPLDAKARNEVGEITQTLKDNLQKVVQHGKRADSIVKNMLLHSREGSGEHRPADINGLLDESLNLAYHGARAEKPQFNVTLQRNFDANAGLIEIFPQEITRVFLNLISNGFYAVTKRKADNATGFDPVISATTRDCGDHVEIRIRDNGTGIPDEVKEKMFNPFFTTKPAGEGTGLGLSMSHDIIVKQHGGTIDVETEPGQFTEFRIVLPRARNFPSENRGQT